jgi:hypothetical protein
MKKMKKKDSELFKPLVATAERYLRDYCDGKQVDDEKAKMFLKVLSLYRKILNVERERDRIKFEWEKLIEGVAELKKTTAIKAKRRRKRSKK